MPALQRELLRQLRAARSRLIAEQPPTEAAVHTARQRIKKARAILRLLRPALGERQFKLENLGLRDTNRLLSAQRDAAVIAGVLDAIARQRPALIVAVARFERQWRQHRTRQGTRRPLLGYPRQAAVRLARAIDRLRQPQAAKLDAPRAAQALRRIYRRARRAFRAAAAAPGDQTWHECRKQTKYLQVALRLQHPVTARYERAARRARLLGRLLGDDHDLALLEAAMRDSAGDLSPADRQLGEHVRDRRRRLQQKASLVGARLYHRTPVAFAAR